MSIISCIQCVPYFQPKRWIFCTTSICSLKYVTRKLAFQCPDLPGSIPAPIRFELGEYRTVVLFCNHYSMMHFKDLQLIKQVPRREEVNTRKTRVHLRIGMIDRPQLLRTLASSCMSTICNTPWKWGSRLWVVLYLQNCLSTAWTGVAIP